MASRSWLPTSTRLLLSPHPPRTLEAHRRWMRLPVRVLGTPSDAGQRQKVGETQRKGSAKNDLSLTRQMWRLLEPVHAVRHCGAEASEEAANLGDAVDTRRPSGFPWRSSPLGAAGRHLVAATFSSFSPGMFAEHVPAA